jgi:hypothetical protein
MAKVMEPHPSEVLKSGEEPRKFVRPHPEHEKASVSVGAIPRSRSSGVWLARDAHFPATLADLYDPEKMPDDLREAHERNDEVLERIYIGRRFRNDTERLEKLFELYTKISSDEKKSPRAHSVPVEPSSQSSWPGVTRPSTP